MGSTDKDHMTGLPSQFFLINNALRNSEQNHRVVSQNISNVNTPGYRTRHLSFDEFMEQVENGAAQHDLVRELPVEFTDGLTERVDGNNVDIDQQVAELKKNSLMFQTYTELLASQMATYRKAISG